MLQCDICLCPSKFVGDKESFQHAVLALLCDIVGGAGADPASTIVAVTKSPVCFLAGGMHYSGYVEERYFGDGSSTETAYDDNRTVLFSRPTFVIENCPCPCPAIAEAIDDVASDAYVGAFTIQVNAAANDSVPLNVTPIYNPATLIPPGAVTVTDLGNGVFDIDGLITGGYAFDYDLVCNSNNEVLATGTVTGEVIDGYLFFTLDGNQPVEWDGAEYTGACFTVDGEGTLITDLADATIFMVNNYPAYNLDPATGGWVGPTGVAIPVTYAALVSTWLTTVPSEDITIPMTVADEVDITVNWGDGTPDTVIFKAAAAAIPASATHTFVTPGIQTISICGSLPTFDTSTTSDADKLRSIEAWGATGIISAVFGGTNAAFVVNDPMPTTVTSFLQMFSGSNSDPDVSGWDTSNVTNMAAVFSNAPNANPDVSNWDTSNVTTLESMFGNTASADPDVSNWNTLNVTNMARVFKDADVANPDVSNWDTSNVTDMAGTFENASVANPDVSNWDTSSVTKFVGMFKGNSVADPDTSGWTTPALIASGLSSMFSGASLANPDVSGWNVSAANTLASMFDGASNANPDITLWDTSNVLSTAATFRASAIDRDFSGWDVANVTNFQDMFSFCAAFMGTGLETWDVSSGTTFSSMFADTLLADPDVSTWVFGIGPSISVSKMFKVTGTANPDVSNWNMTNVDDPNNMFQGALAATPDTTLWDTSSFLTTWGMFFNAPLANPDVTNWDVGAVTDMQQMFQNADSAVPDVSGWNVSSVLNMSNMFRDALLVNPDCSSWNVVNVTNMGNMFTSSPAFTTLNYSNALVQFNATTAQNSVSLHANVTNYTIAIAQAARDNLTGVRLWNISDAGGI